MADEKTKKLGDFGELVADGFEKLGDEVMRFRAWEAVLYLFFGRYYFHKDDPIGTAMWDRDYLANQRRELAQDEAGAKEIERIYEVLSVMIKAAQEHVSASESKDEDALLM